MPRYDYHCDACGHSFEAQQKMSEEPLTDCRLCGAQGSVHRLVGAGTGLIFKGSGFYITDYKNGSTNSSAASSTPSSTSSSTESSKPKSEPSSSCACGTGGCGSSD